MKKTSLLLLLFAFTTLVYGQQLNELYSLPDAVLSRVIDINKNQNINPEKLLKIAALFSKEDSLIASAYKNNGTLGYQSAIRKQTLLDIKSLLSNDEWNKYALTAPGIVNIDNFANNLTQYYLKKYNLDSITNYKTIYATARMQGMMLSPLDKMTSGNIGNSETLLNFYDNQGQKLLYQYEGEYLLQKNIDSLDKIKKLSDSTKLQLKAMFLKSTSTNKHYSYNEHFINAMHYVIDDTIYYAQKYKADIGRIAEANTRRRIVQMMKKMNITSEGGMKIRQVLFQHQRVLALYSISSEKYTKHKDSLMLIADNYYDSLLTIALMHDGHFKHTSMLSTAILYRKQLALRPTLTDTLIFNAQIVNKLWDEYESKKPWGRFDYAKYEAPILEKLLTEEQYRLVLKVKNTPQAEEWAANDWIEIKQRGIDEAMDSSMAISMMKIYNTNMLVIKDRYASDKEKMNNELSGLGVPAVLQRLKRARTIAITKTDSNASAIKQGTENLKDNFKW